MSTNASYGSPIGHSLLMASLFLAASGALSLVSPHLLSVELAHRLLGVFMGCIVVFYANAAPKALPPFAQLRCHPATEQSIRRFSGRALALGGLGYTAASMFAPADKADALAVSFLGTAVLLVVTRHAWSVLGRPAA